MQLLENVPLSSLTTFKVGGNARYVAVCASEEDIQTAVALARDRSLPWYVLGGGSNILASDGGYSGVIIRPLLSELSFGEAGNGTQGDECIVVAGAGVVWDALVQESVDRKLWGLENLAGIPGLVGGAPVQNVGAYGADVSDTLLYVDVFDTKNDTVIRLTKEDCGFGYRDSRFKRDSSLIILRAAFTLATKVEPRTNYPDLAVLRQEGKSLDTPQAIAEAVRTIRSKKFPDLNVSGTAGSFFKNPIITAQKYAEIRAAHPEIPSFPIANPFSTEPSENIKVPLAWILDHILNLRGYTKGHASLFERQPLVLTTTPGATSSEVESLATEVEQKVFEAVGIRIEREVRMLS